MTQDTNVKKTIVGLGEILWDIFPDAAKFGGAPANFACSAAGLKTIPAEVYMLSAVGNDAFGQQAIQSLLSHNVCINAIQQNAKATGRVNVTIDQQGIASYEFRSRHGVGTISSGRMIVQDWRRRLTLYAGERLGSVPKPRKTSFKSSYPQRHPNAYESWTSTSEHLSGANHSYNTHFRWLMS